MPSQIGDTGALDVYVGHVSVGRCNVMGIMIMIPDASLANVTLYMVTTCSI